MNEQSAAPGWFCVRTVVRFGREPAATYEERLTLWQAAGFAEAVGLAEAEASEYASLLDDCVYVGLAQAYELPEAPTHGAEVFSLMRDSTLGADAYVSSFFDTGAERQGNDL